MTTLVQNKLLVREEDALTYAEKVRAEFLSYPHIYEEFLDIMKTCQSQQDITRVILRITRLFQEKTSLIRGFNKFLPDGFNVVIKNNIVYYRTPERPFLSLALKSDEHALSTEQVQVTKHKKDKEVSTVEGMKENGGNHNGKKKLSESIENMKSCLEDTFESSTKLSSKQNSARKKRLRIEIDDSDNQEDDDTVRKRTLEQAAQHNRRSSKRNESTSCPPSFQTFDDLYKDYLSLQKVNETLCETLNEAELQLHNGAKELKAKEKDLHDTKSKLQAKEKELEDVANGTKVKSLEQSLYALKKRMDRDFKALEAASKKADDVSKYVISKKNEEIEMKDKDIYSKNSTIKMQKEEIERLQHELLKARTSNPINAEALPKDLLSELECPICLDPFEDPCIVPECCHRFCTSCIESSIKECGNECPLCRKRVTSKRALRKDGFIERITKIIFCTNQGKGGKDNS